MQFMETSLRANSSTSLESASDYNNNNNNPSGGKSFLSPVKFNKRSSLDIVYIIWTIDDWTSWKYQAAIKNNCRTLPPDKGIIKTYEFFLQNLDTKLQVGQTLQLIICHQIDLTVYKDTNNEDCFRFECAVKI